VKYFFRIRHQCEPDSCRKLSEFQNGEIKNDGEIATLLCTNGTRLIEAGHSKCIFINLLNLNVLHDYQDVENFCWLHR